VAEEIHAAIQPKFVAAAQPNQIAEPGQRVLDIVLVDPSHWFIGWHTAEADAWETHLTDYEVKPLFIQFGRSLMRLDPADADKTEIVDRKGWVLETFQLRGIATKLGYERGQAEDGGWFYEYRKGFTGVGLTAVVNFTGNWLPEENRSAALVSLGFQKDTKRMHQMVPLKDVPEVLLSECWNDLHAMAEKASFNPDWEKTTEW